MNFKAVWNEFTSLTAQEIKNLELMKQEQATRKAKEKLKYDRGIYCVETGERFKTYQELGNYLNMSSMAAKNVIRFNYAIMGKHYKE